MERSSDRVCARCEAVMWTGDRVCPRCGEPRRQAPPPPVRTHDREPAWSTASAPGRADLGRSEQRWAEQPPDDPRTTSRSPVVATLPRRRDREEPPAQRRRHRGGVLLLVVAALLVAVVVAGLALWRTGLLGAGDDASAAGPSPSVSSSSAPRGDASDGASGGASDNSSGGASASPSASGDPLTDGARVDVPSTSAPAVDGNGDPTSYEASNMLDGDPETTWRMDGDGAGATLTFTLDGTRTISELGLVNGYAKTDPESGADRYAQGRRITAVTWTVGADSFDQTLEDGDQSLQSLTIRPVEGDTVTLRIDAVTGPGNPSFDQTAISEVEIVGSGG